jgi:tetratricopeptide (TPR) repeat protein
MNKSAIRTTVSVGAVLLGAFVATGFVSSAYKREQNTLGSRHFQAGQRLTSVNDLTGASEEFRKALLFEPDNPEYRLSLATALVSGNKLEEAESHLEQLSQEDPTNGRINLLLARVAQQEHQLDQAIESYQRAVYEYWPPDQLDSRRQARWDLIGLLEETGRNRDQLVGELLQLYGNLPPHSEQRMRVATLLLRNGADAEAAHVFRDILKDTDVQNGAEALVDRVGAQLGLARIAFRAGDFIEARHEYQRALHENPKDGEAAAALALTNDIIEDSPQLSNISPNERLRRSQGLLTRVEKDVTQCAGGAEAGSPLGQRLAAIKQASSQQLTDKDDAAAQLQQAAQDLWKDRGAFCSQTHGKDPVLEAVLPRLGHE